MLRRHEGNNKLDWLQLQDFKVNALSPRTAGWLRDVHRMFDQQAPTHMSGKVAAIWDAGA